MKPKENLISQLWPWTQYRRCLLRDESRRFALGLSVPLHSLLLSYQEISVSRVNCEPVLTFLAAFLWNCWEGIVSFSLLRVPGSGWCYKLTEETSQERKEPQALRGVSSLWASFTGQRAEVVGNWGAVNNFRTRWVDPSENIRWW